MKQTTREIGDKAERECERFLQNKGLKIIERNFNGRFGEIDLIASEGNCTVFIEVRFRRNTRYGKGFETVGRQKQQRLIRTAEQYLQLHPKAGKGDCRFDVVSMSINGEQFELDWIKNAFEASEA